MDYTSLQDFATELLWGVEAMAGLVVSVSDALFQFKYEKMVVTPGSPAKVVSTPHAPQRLGKNPINFTKIVSQTRHPYDGRKKMNPSPKGDGYSCSEKKKRDLYSLYAC